MSISKEFSEEKRYRKKPIVVRAYQTEKKLSIETLEGTMTANPGDFIITGVKGEQYPCKPDVFFATYDIEDTSITDNVIDNLSEWSSLVTELSSKEIDLYYLKEDIFKKEQDIIKKTDFNTLYGANNKDVRKKHLDGIMAEDYKNKKDLQFSIDYLERRISYLKSLIYTKNISREIKE